MIYWPFHRMTSGLLSFGGVGLALLLGLGATHPVLANTSIAGTASVIDADTLEIHGERIRIFGVDAFESGQLCQLSGRPSRCGQIAALALSDLIGRQVVHCGAPKGNTYGRTVRSCSLGNLDIGSWLVAAGHALDCPRYSRGKYAAEQARAQVERKGAWAGEFLPPWEHRRPRASRPAC
jgi:endonuclease YncB( thermonuclease family)